MQIDISKFGDKELQKAFQKLTDKAQRTTVRKSLKDEAVLVQQRIVANIMRLNLIDSGLMVRAYAASKIRTQGKRTLLRLGIDNPTREMLNIEPDDKYYYPYAVEFGHDNVKAKPFIRPTVKGAEYGMAIGRIGRGIGKGIEREARKIARAKLK
jgi:hypothetical protein